MLFFNLMTCQPCSTGHVADTDTVGSASTFLQRLALPIEFCIPIAIGLSNSYRNIGLTYLSDFNYRTSYIGLPIVR